MKILHITPVYKPAWSYGGPPRSISALCEGLVSIGVETDVITTNANGNQKLNVDCKRSQYIDGVRVFYNKTNLLKPIYSIDFQMEYTSLIPKYDLVHITGVWQISVRKACKLCQQIGKPYVVSPRGALSKWIFSRRSWRKKIYWQAFEKKNNYGSSAIHYSSINEFNDATHCMNYHPYFIAPNAVDFEQFRMNKKAGEAFRKKLGLNENCFVILSLSRVHPTKGIEFLIKALKYLDTNYAALIVGNPENNNYLKLLKQLATDVGVNSRVFFYPHVDGQQKDAVYSCANMFVLPSYLESFGMSIIEAMFYELPVLISPHVNIATNIREHECGYIVDQNAKEIANKIMDISTTSQENIVQNGKEYILNHFSKVAVANQMKLFYLKILKKKFQ